jgi:hypothetical protein
MALQNVVRRSGDVGGLADIERYRFGATASRASLRRPDTTTVQPSAASASAPASPIPLPPPVIQAKRFPLFDMQTVSVAL